MHQQAGGGDVPTGQGVHHIHPVPGGDPCAHRGAWGGQWHWGWVRWRTWQLRVGISMTAIKHTNAVIHTDCCKTVQKKKEKVSDASYSYSFIQ